ncbi:PQQ-dependent sugar dehydrogenase [Arenibaculum pallidiluteum]|uniref:PQQ-dependent sugar dehydrogenase n=1 Tax=Arenibaculum pallidiluteum TaxID=2812559 RepID=UPI001F34CAA1|nr:PQQ-dependent sugar dehydrogenase [Arenibaculum pallidiluteum]
MALAGFSWFGTSLAAALLIAMAGMPPAAAQQQEEEPSWAVGRPKNEEAARMAPIAQSPFPTAADKLPVAKLKVPEGFKVETWSSGILDARGLRQGDDGTVFVSSLFLAGKIYAVRDRGGKREVKTIAEGLEAANGIEYHKGALYVATPKEILRYDAIEANLDSPPKPVKVFDDLPGDAPHGWKFIKIGPDGKLYVPVGAPCNICLPSERHALIMRINPDGSGKEVVARGVRNTVGFDFHPQTGELWFTDNQRDWLAEDMPLDELNRVTEPGKQHFGYPFCHSGLMTDPEFGWGRSCDEFTRPAALLGPHAAPLGMRFYTGTMFPQQYRNAIFIARHGPWNRTKKDADVAVAFLDADGRVRSVEPFLTGFVENNNYLGRPADVMVMKDGSILVSDDHNGAIYRISFGG